MKINKAFLLPLLLLKSKKAIVISGVFLIVIFILGQRVLGSQKNTPQYQTAQVEKGTLVSSLSESGQVIVANRTSITTLASGVISEIDVKNGDTVTAGQKIAVVSLDAEGAQRQAQAWSSYLSAQNSLASANAALHTLQSTMFSKWKTYYDLAQNSTYQNSDRSPNTTNRILTPFTIAQDDWLAAEAAYKNQQGVIAQAEAALNNAWLTYQASSATITASSGGKIIDLTIALGMQIGSSNANSSSAFIGTVKTEGKPLITVNLSETDAVKIKEGQKATITLDALPNQTFSGKILGINTTGTVSSGVTTYPASIQLDLPNDSILPNMSATANIITSVKDNVLLVPSSSVQTINGQSTVRILQNRKIRSVPVKTGNSSETQMEIISGLNVGDTVVTSVTTSVTNGATSPFNNSFRFGGGFGGNARGGR